MSSVLNSRLEPRFSLHALARYVGASSPAERDRIIKDQKYPRVFMPTWYREARTAIRRFLVDSDRNLRDLDAYAERIKQSPTLRRGDVQRLSDNYAAIRSFGRIASVVPLAGFTVTSCGRTPKLTIEGVTVSVQPDVWLQGCARGHNCVGAIKLYINKTAPLKDGAALVSAVVHDLVKRCAPANERAAANRCLTIDVFAEQIVAAPRAIIRLKNEALVACRQIARQWDDI